MRTGIVDRNLSLNGFFGDGMTKNLAHIYKNVSPQRGQEWLKGMEQAMVATKKLFNEINNEIYIIGNAIETYSYQAPDYGSQVLPYVDGVAHCHYAEYEGVVDEQQGIGKLNTTLLLWAFNLSQSIAKGMYLFIYYICLP